VRCARGRGQALVEFALIAPVLLVLALLVLDVGRLFSNWIAITNAAREGAYVATLDYSDAVTTPTIIAAVAGEELSLGIDASQVSITLSPAGDIIDVQVSQPFAPDGAVRAFGTRQLADGEGLG
jgi:uncharacterized membrane protein